MVNSRLDLFTAAPSSSVREGLHPTGAPLIPKLRGNFAEFLNEGFLERLGILYLSTCVGFGTGARDLPRGFSWRHGLGDLRPCGHDITSQSIARWIFLPDPLHACPRTTSAWVPLTYPVPPSVERSLRGTGISTSCPSAFASTYALGPTNPKRINLASETLDFRCACFSQAIRYSYRHSHL